MGGGRCGAGAKTFEIGENLDKNVWRSYTQKITLPVGDIGFLKIRYPYFYL